MDRREAFRRAAAAVLGAMVAPLLPKPIRITAKRDGHKLTGHIWLNSSGTVRTVESVTYYDSQGKINEICGAAYRQLALSQEAAERIRRLADGG